MFEIGDFSGIQASADCVKENNWTLMNSIKFNEVDWTLVVKKEQPKVAIVEEKNE
jgi:NADH-quinone oxidoreductase subunit E